MRNIFDQYKHAENRLTHALASVLHRDPSLLKKFLRWAVPQCRLEKPLIISEQCIPGEPERKEELPEKRGLPDIWIYNKYLEKNNGTALLIESKIMCKLTNDQLIRHLRTAARRGFLKCQLLVLCLKKQKCLPEGVVSKTWAEVYEWFSQFSNQSVWAQLFTNYCEVAEANMVEEKYLTDGSLTKFSGIPFNNDRPYAYVEAKRLLSLLMDELKRDRAFLRNLSIDPNLKGRGAITGKVGNSVWDCLRPACSKRASKFNDYPHYTVSIAFETARALVTLPNGVKASFKRNVLGHGFDKFRDITFAVAQGVRAVFRIEPEAQPYLKIVQRHYKTQKSKAVEDAVLRFDLRTVFESNHKNGVKFQPEYLKAAYEILKKKKSNLQLEMGVEIPYGKSMAIRTARAVLLFKNSFLALKPFVKAALKESDQ